MVVGRLLHRCQRRRTDLFEDLRGFGVAAGLQIGLTQGELVSRFTGFELVGLPERSHGFQKLALLEVNLAKHEVAARPVGLPGSDLLELSLCLGKIARLEGRDSAFPTCL
jgi:hypothetical protein